MKGLKSPDTLRSLSLPLFGDPALAAPHLIRARTLPDSSLQLECGGREWGSGDPLNRRWSCCVGQTVNLGSSLRPEV